MILITFLANNYLDKNIGKKIGVFLGSDTRLKQLDLSKYSTDISIYI